MGSTDLNDQLQSYYLTTVRSRNWHQHRIPFLKSLWWSCLYCTKYEQDGAKLPFNDFIARLVSEWVSITPSVVKKSSKAFVPILATHSQLVMTPWNLAKLTCIVSMRPLKEMRDVSVLFNALEKSLICAKLGIKHYALVKMMLTYVVGRLGTILGGVMLQAFKMLKSSYSGLWSIYNLFISMF